MPGEETSHDFVFEGRDGIPFELVADPSIITLYGEPYSEERYQDIYRIDRSSG
jgi:hypothetical protein